MFFSLKIKAGYRAGDITYRWLHGYTYEIRFTTFTDNVGPDNYCTIDSICYGDGTGGSIGRANGPTTFCSPAHDGVPIYPSVKMNEYITTHTYPGPGNYSFCFNQPNRNPGINNIPNSVNQTISFESILNIPMFAGINNSPVFANYPIAFGCLNNGCFTYNAMGVDSDGDSLAYKLLPCSGTGPIPGYSFPGAGTGNTFSIDPVTGLLTWCNPQLNGDYNVVIKIEEWRKNDDGDYFLIGYVNRDTQFTIDNCTGISDIVEKDQTITLFPNPVTDNIEIKFDGEPLETYTIELFDVTGREIKTVINKQHPSGQNAFYVNMEGFHSGVYFIKIISDDQTITKKIIKQ